MMVSVLVGDLFPKPDIDRASKYGLGVRIVST